MYVTSITSILVALSVEAHIRLICLFTLLTLVACAGSSSLSYSHLMTASWLLRSSQGRPIIALPYIRVMRARVAAGQASLPCMQVH